MQSPKLVINYIVSKMWWVLLLILPAQLCALSLPSATPHWKRVLEESYLIAKVEFLADGNSRAPVRPISIFKGDSIADKIWVSGWGKTNSPVKKGDQAFLFLVNNFEMPPMDRWYKKGMKRKQIREERKFRRAHTNNMAFISQASSYFLPIKNARVNYDLAAKNNATPRAQDSQEFEAFLDAISGVNKTKFHSTVLDKLSTTDKDTFKYSQYLMMLYYSGYSGYLDETEEIKTSTNPKTQYALVHLLQNVRNTRSRKLLSELLYDSLYHNCQTEIIESLSADTSIETGEILIKFLLNGKNALTPADYNLIDPAHLTAIGALGHIKHKPATNVLAPLLGRENQNKGLFRLTFKVLEAIEPDFDFSPYLTDHLKNPPNKFWFTIATEITSRKRADYSFFIENAIRQSDRNEIYGSVLIMCLAEFNNPKTQNFLKKDLSLFLEQVDQYPCRSSREWLLTYLDTFFQLGIKDAKKEVYQALYMFTGIDQNFAESHQLLTYKKELEDSLKQTVNAQLKDFEVSKVIAYIQNSEEVLAGARPIAEFEVKLNSKFDPTYYGENLFTQTRINELSAISQLSLKQLGIYRNTAGEYHLKDRIQFEFDSRLKWALLAYIFDMGNEKDRALIKILDPEMVEVLEN